MASILLVTDTSSVLLVALAFFSFCWLFCMPTTTPLLARLNLRLARLPAKMQASLARQWVIDTGSGAHTCNDRALFTAYTALRKGNYAMGVGGKVPILGVGTVRITLRNGKSLWLNGVDHCGCSESGEEVNILSVAKILDLGEYEAAFGKRECIFLHEGKETSIKGTRYDDVYWLDVQSEKTVAPKEKTSTGRVEKRNASKGKKAVLKGVRR